MGTFNPDTLRSLIGNRGGFATTEKFEVINFFNNGIRRDFPSSTGLTIVRKK